MSYKLNVKPVSSSKNIGSVLIDLSSDPSINSQSVALFTPVLELVGNAGYTTDSIIIPESSFMGPIRSLMFNFRPFYNKIDGDNANNTTIEQIAGPCVVYDPTTGQAITISYKAPSFSYDGTHYYRTSFESVQGAVPFFANNNDTIQLVSYQLFDPGRGKIYLQFADFDVLPWYAQMDGINIQTS